MKAIFILGVLLRIGPLFSDSYSTHLCDAKAIAFEAGQKMIQIRNAGDLQSEDVQLPNGKIVRQTHADLESGEYILAMLSLLYPDYGLVSQDHLDQDRNWDEKEFVWLINPIDGTKEFEQGNDDFHVQIGLLKGELPILGVSYYPATDVYIWAIQGQGAWMETKGIKQRLIAQSSLEKILIQSSSHAAIFPFLSKLGWVPNQVLAGKMSSTTRLLAIIQGKASLYISLGSFPPYGIEKKGGIWNYGANAVIAAEAGVILTTLKGRSLHLREKSALLTEGVVLTTDPVLCEQMVKFFD